MNDITDKTINEVMSSYLDPNSIASDAILSGYNPKVTNKKISQPVKNIHNKINKINNGNIKINREEATAKEFYETSAKELSKLYEQWYDYDNKKFKDNIPTKDFDNIVKLTNLFADINNKEITTDEDMYNLVHNDELKNSDKLSRLPKDVLSFGTGGVLGAMIDASDKGFFGVGRNLNIAADYITPDWLPFLGKFTKYNEKEWDDFHNYYADLEDKYLDYISNTKNDRKHYERAYSLGRLFAPLSPNAKLRAANTAIKGITNPKVLKYTNYGLNTTGMALGATLPGLDFEGWKNLLWQTPVNSLIFETDRYLFNRFGLFNDYTLPEDRLNVSVLFDNLGSTNKDRPVYSLVSEEGENKFARFILNETERNIHDYNKAKDNYENSLLKFGGGLGSLLLTKKYGDKALNLWKNGKNKVLDSINNAYKNQNIFNLEKINRIRDSLTPSLRFYSSVVDKYSVLDEMINRNLIDKKDVPLFYRDKSTIKDAMYNTGVINSKVKLKVAPKITDQLIQTLRKDNPKLFSVFDEYINQSNQLRFIMDKQKLNNFIPDNLEHSKKYNNFIKNYEILRGNKITSDLLDQLSSINKTIDNSLGITNRDVVVGKNVFPVIRKRLSVSPNLTLSDRIKNIIDIGDPLDSIDSVYLENSVNYKPFNETFKPDLEQIVDDYIENTNKKILLSGFDKKTKESFKQNVKNKLLNKTSKSNNAEYVENLIHNTYKDFYKTYHVRYVGTIDLEDSLKNVIEDKGIKGDSLDAAYFMQKVKDDAMLKEFVKVNKKIGHADTNKALKYLRENKNPNNIVTYIEDNKLHVYKTDEMIGALFNTNPEQIGLLSKVNRTFKKLQETVTTGKLNPFFSAKSAEYSAQEGATALMGIIEDITKELGLENVIRGKRSDEIIEGYSSLGTGITNEIQKTNKLSKLFKKKSKSYEKVIPKDAEHAKKIAKVTINGYLKETILAGKELINQKKAADLVNNHIRLLSDAYTNGASQEELQQLYSQLGQLQKKYENFLSTRLQMSGLVSKSPFGRLDDTKLSEVGVDIFKNPEILNNIDPGLRDWINGAQILIRESPVLGLTTYLGRRLGYISDNGRIVSQEGMDALTKAIAHNTANNNIKGNNLKTSGKIANFIRHESNYGDVLIKSVAAKAHAVGLGKFTDNIIKDAKMLLDKDVTFGEAFDVIANQLKDLGNKPALRYTLGGWGSIGFTNYLMNHRDSETIEDYYKIPLHERVNNIIITNAFGRGKHIKIPIDQEFGIILSWGGVVADSLLGLSELNPSDPEFTSKKQLAKAISRSLTPGNIPLLNNTLALAGQEVEYDVTSPFFGIRNVGNDVPNANGNKTKYPEGVMSSYAQNVIQEFFGLYGTIFVSAVEEGNASLKSDSAIKDTSKLLLEKFTQPVHFITSKIDRYNQTNEYNYNYKKIISDNNLVADNFNPVTADAHRLVNMFYNNRISKLDELISHANAEKKKQKSNANKDIILDYEGRKYNIKSIDDFIIKINKRINDQYDILNNSLGYYIKQEYGVDNITIDNYKDILQGEFNEY